MVEKEILAGFVYTYPACPHAVRAVSKSIFLLIFQINLINDGGCCLVVVVFFLSWPRSRIADGGGQWDAARPCFHSHSMLM